MKDEFNNGADPRPHHYILKLSRTAGADRPENPDDRNKPAFQQAVLFVQRLKEWAESRGQADNLKMELLPVMGDGHPRVRLACPPRLMADIRDYFERKIRAVDEIPLPKPGRGKKSIWKRIFGG